MRCGPMRQRYTRCQTGFTLIEILVVMLIIAIVSGIAVLSLRTSTDDGPRGAADHFRAALNAVALDSLTKSRQYGLRIWQDGYAFVHLNAKGKWVPAAVAQGAQADGSHALPQGLRARLRIAEQRVSLPLRQETSPPQVLVLSNGEMTPFEIVFAPDRPEDNDAVRVVADAVGHLSTSDGSADAPH